MKNPQEKITVGLDRRQQDFLQRLGLACLLNSKYGPSLKMFWARLVENRTPIFFGAFIISFVAFLISFSVASYANHKMKEQSEKITKLILEKHKLQKAFNFMVYKETHGPFQHVDREPKRIVVEVSKEGSVKTISSKE